MDRILEVPFGDRWVEFATRINPGFDYLITDKIVIREIFVENVYRMDSSRLSDTGIVFDIGANIGAFSIYCALLGAKKVYAFEPDTHNFEILKYNIEQNKMGGIIIPIKLGIFKTAGRVKLFSGQGASFLEDQKWLNPKVKKAIETGVPEEQIETITLASAFANNDVVNCDVLKVDVEGSEYAIFEQAEPDVLAKARYITVEFHTSKPEAFGSITSKLSKTHKIEILKNLITK